MEEMDTAKYGKGAFLTAYETTTKPSPTEGRMGVSGRSSDAPPALQDGFMNSLGRTGEPVKESSVAYRRVAGYSVQERIEPVSGRRVYVRLRPFTRCADSRTARQPIHSVSLIGGEVKQMLFFIEHIKGCDGGMNP